MKERNGNLKVASRIESSDLCHVLTLSTEFVRCCRCFALPNHPAWSCAGEGVA